jgi:aryl-phospho-beta-D-glucosidase BglC (GH1 family)
MSINEYIMMTSIRAVDSKNKRKNFEIPVKFPSEKKADSIWEDWHLSGQVHSCVERALPGGYRIYVGEGMGYCAPEFNYQIHNWYDFIQTYPYPLNLVTWCPDEDHSSEMEDEEHSE